LTRLVRGGHHLTDKVRKEIAFFLLQIKDLNIIKMLGKSRIGSKGQVFAKEFGSVGGVSVGGLILLGTIPFLLPGFQMLAQILLKGGVRKLPEF
jgi:hypothetical protein